MLLTSTRGAIASNMRKKISSKRRWIARFKLGREIPAMALAEYKGLTARLLPAMPHSTKDCIVKVPAAVAETNRIKKICAMAKTPSGTKRYNEIWPFTLVGNS